MSEARDAGRMLDALAFGLGAKKKRAPASAPKDVYETLTKDSPGSGSTKRPTITSCSCTRRRVKP